MIKRREPLEVMLEIKKDMPEFIKEDLLKYTEWVIPYLYELIVKDEEINIKCNIELIDKLKKNKEEYRITENMDRVYVEFTDLFDYINNNDENYIQVYASVRFHDDTRNNNDNNNQLNNQFWNDVWIVSLKRCDNPQKNNNCKNCGAPLKYNKIKNIYECEYCGYNIHPNTNMEWEIVDIIRGE